VSTSLSADDEREYEELAVFIGAYATRFWGFAPAHPLNPANVSRESEAMFGKVKALAGLRQAVNAMLEESQDLEPGQVEQFDAQLRDLGGIGLSELRERNARRYRHARERGAIGGDAEYHVVQAVLEESGPILSADERELLSGMLRKFELLRDS
jgi:hypothetical protein